MYPFTKAEQLVMSFIWWIEYSNPRFYEEEFQNEPTWDRARIMDWCELMTIQNCELYDDPRYALISTKAIREAFNCERMAEYLNDAIIDMFIQQMFEENTDNPKWAI